MSPLYDFVSVFVSSLIPKSVQGGVESRGRRTATPTEHVESVSS